MLKLLKVTTSVILATSIAFSLAPLASAKSKEETQIDKQSQKPKHDDKSQKPKPNEPTTDIEVLTVDQVLNDPRYKELNITPEDAKLYRKIEDIKKQYPSASIDEIIKHMEPSPDTVQIQLTYDQIVAQWKNLTFTEKALAIASPAQALLVDKCRAWALSYTSQSKWGNLYGNGTRNDAFRHAMWNVLMSKYIGKANAEIWANAHEAQTEEYFNKYTDGISNRDHSTMDYHNNAKGRDCIFWNEVFISDSTLFDRVTAKIDAGEMMILLPDSYQP
ncbi:DUF6973 domain-containing protein [Paenibacillus chitinolyticus]|uniref:DUF6973 domain-containing protein n=1 Tax=Paenibacillus chitinolyticus TaxID=79263 RepID=UPI003864BF37